MIATIKILGWLLARLPLPITEAISVSIGGFLYLLPGKRRRIQMSNLHHAFPEKSKNWQNRIALENCRRIVEMGMLVLALPYVSRRKLELRIQINRELKTTINQWIKNKKPIILLVPHFTLFEYLPMLPIFFEVGELKAGAIFRPLDNPELDTWVRKTREKYGLRLLSRKAGFGEAKQILTENGILGILFDQNAGRSGTLMNFFDRVASTTDLSASMAKRFNAETYIFHPKRLRFWEASINLKKLDCPTPEIPQVANDWLQSKLSESEDSCADWLWFHDRWKTVNHPSQRFQLNNHRKLQISSDRAISGYRLWIRMPNWLGDVVMALPLIKALGKSRPDADITLICQSAYIPLLKLLEMGNSYISIPPKTKRGYFERFKRLKNCFPDTQLILTNSTRGDIESKHIGAPQRFGIIMPGKPRPLITNGYRPNSEVLSDVKNLHQTRLWEKMLNHFGLLDHISETPLELAGTSRKPSKIGLIPGSSNNPEKCWPIANWTHLAKRIIGEGEKFEIHLYGTQIDRVVTEKIASDLNADRIFNHAGKTDLNSLAFELASCSQVIGNDTGGIHLANCLGTAVVVLYGPTNPRVTGPFYSGNRTVIQPKNCPSQGGFPISSVSVDAVFDQFLKNT